MNRKQEGENTRKIILDWGIILAAGKSGLEGFRSTDLASRSGVSHSVIFYHFKTMDDLRDAIAAEAIERDDVTVIARLIVGKHPRITGWTRARCGRYLKAAL